jgi:hypothetical protein
MKSLINIFVILLILITGNALAQNVFGPEQPNYIREMEKIGSGNATSQLRSINGTCLIGKTVYGSGQAELRTLIQWNIPDNSIPDNSTITRVRLYFTYSRIDHSFNLNVDFVSISLDIASLNQTQNNQIWNEFNTNFIELGYGSNDVMVFESNNPNNDFNLAVRNALLNDRFVLGMRAYASVSERLWMIENPSITLELEFEPPTQLVTIDQRNSFNDQIGKLKKWEEEEIWSDEFDPGSEFYFPVSSQQTILGDQTIIGNQKYNNWNEDFSDVKNHHNFTITTFTDALTSNFIPTYSGVTIKNVLEGTNLTGGTLFFYDPWLIDYPDPAFGNQKRNQGMSAPPKQRNSPFYPDYTTNYSGDVYQGVFLNQNPQFQSDLPIYNVWAGNQLINLGSSIGVRQFYFQNWAATGANLQSFGPGNQQRVVFTSGDAVIQANFKGQGLSNQTNAYANNSQRKFVRTDDGWLHSVYESLGRVWYEASSNNGVTWQLMNGGQPLDNGEGKLPSIDYSLFSVSLEDYYQIFIVYQEKYGSNTKVKVKYFQSLAGGPYFFRYQADVATVSQSYYNANTTPVIAAYNGSFTVIWKNGTDKLYARSGGVNIFSGISLNNPNSLTQTTANSINPAIYSSKTCCDWIRTLAWEETSGSTSAIKYGTLDGIQPVTIPTVTTPSSGSGYTRNYQPSIIELNGTARIVWIGYREIAHDKEIDKMGKTNSVNDEYRVVFKASDYYYFWNFGNNVNSPNINKINNNTGYIFAWSESTTGGFVNKFGNQTLSTPKTIPNISGRDVQVSNGPANTSMYANVFNNLQTPYYFTVSQSLGSIQKVNSLAFSSGREGVVYKGEGQFYFMVGDVKVDEQVIDFIEIPDTVNINDREALNAYLITEPFVLTDNSNFFYGVQYGITDSLQQQIHLIMMILLISRLSLQICDR